MNRSRVATKKNKKKERGQNRFSAEKEETMAIQSAVQKSKEL